MVDLVGGLPVKLRQALRAHAGTAGLVGTRVFDHVPAESVYPLIVLAEASSTAELGQCWNAEEAYLDLHVFSRPADRGAQEARDVMGQAIEALHGASIDLGAGVALALLHRWTQRLFRDPDGLTWHGVVTFRAETHEVE